MASIFDSTSSLVQAIKGQDDSPAQGQLYLPSQADLNNGLGAPSAGIDKNWVFVGDQEIDTVRWNKSYPYQLLILKRSGNGYVGTQWSFSLPIPPQEMTVSTPFAIMTSITLGGVVEEHNGAPVRMINFSGTTGVQPLRGITGTLGQSNLAQAIFAGTVNAIGQAASAVQSAVGHPASPGNLMSEKDAAQTSTGYYQFRLLQRFLEGYAAMKKRGDKELRLALAVWKDQSVYLVTPVSFDVKRSSQSPWEYNYSLSFKAWRRVVVNGADVDPIPAFTPVTRDPNAFAQLMNSLQACREAMQGARSILQAIRGDIDNLLFEPMREVVLFAKDTLGVALTAADLPSNIQSDLKEAQLEAHSDLHSLSQDLPDASLVYQNLSGLSVSSGKAETGSGQSSQTLTQLGGGSPANSIFGDPLYHFDVMNKIQVSRLNLSPAIQKKISDERRRVSQLTRKNFETFRDNLVEFQGIFADSVGAGSASYNAVYNRSPAATAKTPTPDDFDVLYSLNQAIIEMNKLAASSAIDDRNRITTIESVAGMASASGIAFKVPTSKFAVPFQYGQTLEQMSLRYLGDPNRWHEIVALNGLQQPYVDEVGFDLTLLTNGKSNQVVVGDSSNLYLGQPVWLSSNSTSRTKRRITGIDNGHSGSVVTLDGDQDLDRFTTLAGSTLHAFLPNTVNSMQVIYIPSDKTPSEDDFGTKAIPGINDFDQYLQAGGVDLLMTSDGDLAITPDGDCKLAVGLANLTQQIRNAISTPKGSLIHHPEYGLGIVPGVSTADMDVRSLKTALQAMFRSDSTFTGLQGVSISKNGPVLSVSMGVGVSGVNQTIPVSIDIVR